MDKISAAPRFCDFTKKDRKRCQILNVFETLFMEYHNDIRIQYYEELKLIRFISTLQNPTLTCYEVCCYVGSDKIAIREKSLIENRNCFIDFFYADPNFLDKIKLFLLKQLYILKDEHE